MEAIFYLFLNPKRLAQFPNTITLRGMYDMVIRPYIIASDSLDANSTTYWLGDFRLT